MKKETILYGTAVLIFTNSAVKLMSLVYRGVMIRLIGAEGLGLTEIMMPFYSFLIVIASLGIPLAISNFISAETDEKRIGDIFRTGTVLLIVNGLAVTLLTLFLFPLIRDIVFSDRRVDPAFLVLIPSVFLISAFSALRGFFQGSGLSSVIGKSQVTEQFARLAVGIALVSLLIRSGCSLPVLIIGFALASLIAEFCGGVYLLRKHKKIRSSRKGTFRKDLASRMLRTGAPITMSRIVISLTSAVQAVIIPRILVSMGASVGEAATFYGLFAGVALTVLHLPSVVTGALTTPLMPAIAEANGRGETRLRNERIAKSIRFTNYTALPVLILLFYFAEEICDLLFASPQAGYYLSFLSLGGIFLYLQQPVITILQGMNRFSRLFFHFCAADILYIAALAALWICGAFTAERLMAVFIANDLMLFGLNYFYLKRITHFRLSFIKTYAAPLVASAAALIAVISAEKYIMQTNITNLWSMILSACLFFLMYVFTLYISGTFDKELISSLLSRRKHH